VPARVEATRFIRHAYWCADCQGKKTAPYASEEVPYGYVGPNVLIWTILMKYQYGLPFSKIRLLFGQLCGLTISQSALAQALQRLSRWLAVEEGVILEAIRASPHLHMDETGWKIAGGNHWLWAAVNERLALYRIEKSRGQHVPEEILTKDYGGVVVSDFLSAYNRIGRRRQRCLVHLLREMKDCRETDESPEYTWAHRKLARILADARRLNDSRGKFAIWIFFRRVRRLKARLFDFVARPYTNGNCRRLAKRLRRCYEEILTFLEVPGLPWENNLAERMIRPNVLLRKVSFQNMSRRGADAHQTLMSLVQTLRLQDRDPVSFLKTAFLRHRQGNPAPLLHLATVR
jgi:transposase-like protein